MSRAQGKHTQRDPNAPEAVPLSGVPREAGPSTRQPDPDTPEGSYIGVSDHQIPGGQNHIVNPVTTRQKVPVAARRPEFRGMMAHGVDAPAGHHDRDIHDQAKAAVPDHLPAAEKIHPIPVIVVAQAGGEETILAASPRHFTLQASTGEPVRICGIDRTRVQVQLLNEYAGTSGSATGNIRFAQRETDLVGGGGALLPWVANSYLKLQTQSELYAISADSSTPVISVIQEFEQKW
jgi:hypothetical protein